MKYKNKTVCVMGLGYIGLPTASLLASSGYNVVGVDINKIVIDLVNEGKTHIYEPELDDLLKKVIKEGRLVAKIKPERADVFIIAVPTPFTNNYKPDINYVMCAIRDIAPYIENGNIIVLESTSPLGTTEKIAECLKEIRNDLNIQVNNTQLSGFNSKQVYISYCPERVLPGRILQELIENDRVIGGINVKSAEKTRAFYSEFVKGDLRITDSKTAEMVKLTENSFRDVNIAFANELSMICDKVGVNVWELIKIANYHPRVNILQPGPGVGGHCIAVDPWFLVDAAPKETLLIKSARRINDYKSEYILERIMEAVIKIDKPVIACFGISFKADIDDLRESPALKIVKCLSNKIEQNILIVEPNIKELPVELKTNRNLQLVSTEVATKNADILVLLVNHREFYGLTINATKKAIIDTRGIWGIY